MEINKPGSLLFFGQNEYQLLLYALLGLVFLGCGYCLRRTSFAEFATTTEALGLLAFQVFSYPLTLGIWDDARQGLPTMNPWLFPSMAAIALVLLALGISQRKGLKLNWRWAWGVTLAGGVALLACQLYFMPHTTWGPNWHEASYGWVAVLVLFVFSLAQIQVGLQERSPYMVNLGVAFIALHIISTYLRLIGSMARTGTIFVISGVFLIAFGIYLEKKRRALMRQMQIAAN